MPEQPQPQLVEPKLSDIAHMDIERARSESYFAYWWHATQEKHPRWQRGAFAAVQDTILWIAKEAFFVGVAVGMKLERDKHE